MAGIKPAVLSNFQRQLSEDFQRTVERFLALQTPGTETARQDARTLKSIVLALPAPGVEVLNAGLEILRTADLRDEMRQLAVPLLRLYGALDGLVPRKVAALLDEARRRVNRPLWRKRHTRRLFPILNSFASNWLISRRKQITDFFITKWRIVDYGP